MAKWDLVDKPSHYGTGSIECLDYIEDSLTEEEYIGYLRGNITKYLHRHRYKGKPVEDLRKAEFYLKRLIKVEDNLNEKSKQSTFHDTNDDSGVNGNQGSFRSQRTKGHS